MGFGVLAVAATSIQVGGLDVERPPTLDVKSRQANLTRPARQISIAPSGALQKQNPARPAESGVGHPRSRDGSVTETQDEPDT